MTGSPTPFKPSANTEANEQYASGQKKLTAGDVEAALTWFRRAALTDPNFFSALMQIGFLCRDKARLDKIFARYAYEAFQKAANLDLTSEPAHNQFILAASQSGRLEELLLAYDKWLAIEPNNALLLTCKKNVITLSMAMIPQSVDINDAGSSSGLKKFVLIGSIFLILTGLGTLIATPILAKSEKIDKKNIRNMAPVGFVITTMGLAGFFSRRYL